MLLWKSWRDLRIAFLVGLGWLALLAVGVTQYSLRSPSGPPTAVANAGQTVAVLMVFVLMQTVVFTLIAWAMGTFGIGRDIGAGSGSFVLSRPVPRGYFVWTEWASGLIALGVLLLLSALGLWLAVRFHAIQITTSTSTSTGTGVTATLQTSSLASLPVGPAALQVLCAFLFLALVFGVTHLGTVAFRHSTAGLLFSLSFFVGWLIITTILGHEYPRIAPHIPDLLLRPFGGDPEQMQLVPHLTASLLIRIAILPLFPLLAHFLLRRTEV